MEVGCCGKNPNCVSTEETREAWKIDPIRFEGSAVEAQQKFLRVLSEMPRTTILEEGDGFLRVRFRTLIFRFPDFADFVFDGEAHLIRFRSRARYGRRDFGVNRKRIEEIRRRFSAA